MSKLSDEDYRSIPLNATLALAALVVIIAGMKVGADLLVPLLLAVFIVVVCTSPVQWLHRCGLSRRMSALITLLVLVGFISLIGLLVGGIDFSNLFVVLREGVAGAPYATLAEAQAAGAVTLNVGLFINAVVSFSIVAFVVFLLVRTINRLKREEAVAPADPTEKPCPYCLMVVPIKAVRCGHCTSELQAAASEKPTESV